MATRGKRRALGQHFLRDRGVIAAITAKGSGEAARLGCDQLLEIGPGRGAITGPLAEAAPRSGYRLLLVEKDDALAAKWASSGLPEVEVIHADFLDLSPADWLRGTKTAVVSNLPYSAGTAILDRLARHPGRIAVMILMFQAEVGRRIRAEPNARERGSLSVWVQNAWEVKRLLAVAPAAFAPPPEVTSEVVLFHPRPEPMVPGTLDGEGATRWESLLKAAFAHRRKMLRSGLAAPWRIALERSGVDGTKRAQALEWEDWRRLFEARD